MPRVLIVEDNRRDAQLMEWAFRLPPPWEVVWVGSGEEALDYFRGRGPHADTGLPDLIVLNLRLPGMHGGEVLEEIKRDPSLRKIPVVMWSVCSIQVDIDKLYGLGAAVYLVKRVRSREERRQALALRRLFDMAHFPCVSRHALET